MKNFSFKNNSGFTIIETMISISVFLVVVMIGMDALLNVGVLHQKSQDISSILDNLSFSMEDMAKNIRTGYDYRCITANSDLAQGSIGNPQSGQNCWGIAFESSTGNATDWTDQWAYIIDNSTGHGKLLKATQGSVSSPYTSVSNYAQLTTDEINIDTLQSNFSILGAEAPLANDKQQPFVVIHLVGTITYKNTVTPFSLQTSISQRLLDR